MVSDMKYYLISNFDIAWGDWGNILWSGFVVWDGREYKLERCGPFYPDIYISDNGLVFSEKAKLSISRFKFFDVDDFVKINKSKIVNVDWTKWDKTKSITYYLDDLYELEDIINNGENDIELLNNMPDFFLVDELKLGHVFIDKSLTKIKERYKVNKTLSMDFFQGIEYRGYFVSERAKKWLSDFYPHCFAFEEVGMID